MQNKQDLSADIIEAILDKKGQKITIIDLSEIESAPASEMIICQARSTSQVSAVADNIIDSVNDKLHVKPYATDGFRNSQWIIVDYGNIMVHVFQPEVREFYRLEELWSDGKIKELPDPD